MSTIISNSPCAWHEYVAELRMPVWQALSTQQTALCETVGPVKRYSKEFAPFGAVATQGAAVSADELLRHGDVMFSGELPTLLGTGFSISENTMMQMIAPDTFTAKIPGLIGQPDVHVDALGQDDIPDMMQLTAMCGLGQFFRHRTAELGPYFGIRHHGKLVAMAGERMQWPHFFELSGVCTAPDYTGQGLARYLMCRLAQQNRVAHPMLHTMGTNTHAIRLYEKMGFALTHQFPSVHVQRVTL